MVLFSKSISQFVILGTNEKKNNSASFTYLLPQNYKSNWFFNIFSLFLQNEPEDLTGNRRGSNHHEENNDGLQ